MLTTLTTKDEQDKWIELQNKGIDIQWLVGSQPVQAEGMVNGKGFYFKARGQAWSMSVARTRAIQDAIDNNPVNWTHREYHDDAGNMSFIEAMEFIEWCADQISKGL